MNEQNILNAINDIAEQINNYSSIIQGETQRSSIYTSPLSPEKLKEAKTKRKKFRVLYDNLVKLIKTGGQKKYRKNVTHRRYKKSNKYYKTAKKRYRAVTRRRHKRAKKYYKM